MAMSPEATGVSRTSSAYPHPIAFTVQLSRNLVVQILGMTMVCLMGLSVLRWPAVLAWAVIAVVAVGAENQLLRHMATRGFSKAGAAWAAGLRIFTTSVYALAALVLIARGGPGERLFAFALMSASMVHVLMRYYRSPVILGACLAPYLAILGLVGWGLMVRALEHGHLLGALAPAFTIAMFAVQFWSARAQLAGAWIELMAAREAAEAREKAADAANRAKSEFLANMSHELRTPLNGVLGMAQALTSDHLTAVQRERVRIIRRSSESLLSVLNDLLDLSKVEASTLDLEPVAFDLEHLVRGVAAIYRPLAAKKDLGFEFEISDAAAGRYLGDAGRIRRVLYSLADNAVKFTQTGGVTLRIDEEGEQVVFRVVDTGIGIEACHLARLFEGFFQADATLTRRHGGSGIGLAVCSQLTALMGGVIAAESTPGVGSTFTFRLALERLESAEEPKASQDRAAPADGAADLKILAAEDNPTNQLVLKTLLAPAGLTPSMANNGKEALAAWEEQDWDIILMDIQMPEMDGIEATRAIRLRERATGRARTPIVAVTANAMTHQIADYMEAGMDGVVAKPIDMTALFQAMDRALAPASDGADAEQREAAG
ncbi:MAG: sensor histidine kinase/response regulator [Caulobacter sp.]|nr:sensor histidine kinase/response regulator [Caulobacter sp.]